MQQSSSALLKVDCTCKTYQHSPFSCIKELCPDAAALLPAHLAIGVQEWATTASQACQYGHLQEATLLLSALAAALHTCQVPWPAFVPVHDAQRDAHWGIAALQSTTVHLNTDCVHTSSTPVALKEVGCLPVECLSSLVVQS